MPLINVWKVKQVALVFVQVIVFGCIKVSVLSSHTGTKSRSSDSCMMRPTIRYMIQVCALHQTSVSPLSLAVSLISAPSIRLCLSLYLSVSLSLCLFLCLFLSVYVSLSLSVSLSLCLSPPLCPSVSVSLSLSVSVSVCLCLCLSLYLCLTVCLSLCLCLFI